MEDAVGFIRKVFGIVAMQMGVTFAFALGGAILRGGASGTKHPFVVIVCVAGILGFGLTICWGDDIRKKVPHGYLLLGGFTLCEATSFAALTSTMDV